ncbi:MAG TPA: tetratricopeptide repeat protein [Thermodesulfobacteriota bacterium]|nr:tetratricopeptide repeat protein [Thermodesulfobacteriota bacterium]
MPREGAYIIRKVFFVSLLAVLSVFASSCQTVEKKEVVSVEVEPREEHWATVMREWEDYMQMAVTDKNPSVDTILRFTELYLEADDVIYKKRMEAYESDTALHSKGRLDEEPRLPQKDYSKLIKYFRPLVERHIEAKGSDALMYALGYALSEQGKRDEAAEIFEGLISKYPRSPFVTEVSFKLGEFYFESGQLGEARASYKKVLEYPYSSFYEKALYKLGWVYYKTDDLKGALSAFTDVVERHRGEEAGLGEEALRGVVLSLNQFKSAEEAVKYFISRGGKEYMPPILKRFGGLLISETRYEAALYVYRTIVESFPDDPEIPFSYSQIAELYERMGDGEAALRERFSLIQRFNPETAWYRKTYPVRSEKVDSFLSSAMLEVSRAYHSIGKKTSDAKKFQNAIEGYRLFVASFPASVNFREANLLLAEALFDAAAYSEAAVEYEKSAKLYPEGKERGEIAYSAFLAYEVVFYQSQKDRDEYLKGAGEVLNTYKKDLAASLSLDEALFKLSDMDAQMGSFAMARERLKTMLEGPGKVAAYKKTAEFYIAEGNLPDAEKSYTEALERGNDPGIRETIAKLRYNIAEEYLKKGNIEDAALKFEEVFKTMPGGKVAESALLKLGRIYIDRKDANKFDSVIKRLEKTYPGSEVEITLFVEAGRDMEKEGPLKAAGFYEHAFSLTQKTPDTLKLLFAAGILYEKAGDYKDAEDVFKRFLDSKEMVKEKEVLEATYRLGSAQIKGGKKKAGLSTLSVLIGQAKEANSQFVAAARLFLLNDRLEGYLKVTLAQPFEETLKKKNELLDALTREYSELLNGNAAELLPEIFFSMGTALENFKDSVLFSERPADLTEDELKEYNFLLEETAYPYEERAVSAYENGIKAGAVQKLYGEWVEKSIERLKTLRPALYKRQFEEDDLSPVYVHEPAVGSQKAGGGGV